MIYTFTVIIFYVFVRAVAILFLPLGYHDPRLHENNNVFIHSRDRDLLSTHSRDLSVLLLLPHPLSNGPGKCSVKFDEILKHDMLNINKLLINCNNRAVREGGGEACGSSSIQFALQQKHNSLIADKPGWRIEKSFLLSLQLLGLTGLSETYCAWLLFCVAPDQTCH